MKGIILIGLPFFSLLFSLACLNASTVTPGEAASRPDLSAGSAGAAYSSSLPLKKPRVPKGTPAHVKGDLLASAPTGGAKDATVNLQTEDGIRKRSHLKVLLSDTYGSHVIDFARVHAALAFEQEQLLTTQKNTALMAYSLVLRDKAGAISVKTFPIFFYPRNRFSSGDGTVMYFVSGSPFDGATHTDGVIVEPLTHKDLEVSKAVKSTGLDRGAGASSSIAATDSPPDDELVAATQEEDPTVREFQALFTRRFYSAKTLYASELVKKLEKRYGRPTSAIYGNAFSKQMREFLFYHEIMQSASLLNVNDISKEYAAKLQDLERYFGDTEQTMLNVLDSEHFQKQVIENVDDSIKNGDYVIGIMVHIHSKYSPCRQCSVSIFADNEREDGYLKTLQRYVASVQTNFSPKVLTLFSYAHVWPRGETDNRGGGKEFNIRGLDADSPNLSPPAPVGIAAVSSAVEGRMDTPYINPSHFFPFVPVVMIKPDKPSWQVLQSLYAEHVPSKKTRKPELDEALELIKNHFYTSEMPADFGYAGRLSTQSLCDVPPLPAADVELALLPTPEAYHLNNLHALIQGLGGTDVVRDFLKHLLGLEGKKGVYGTPSRRGARHYSASASLGRSASVGVEAIPGGSGSSPERGDSLSSGLSAMVGSAALPRNLDAALSEVSGTHH